MSADTQTAARAAYRLGLLDALLHPDVVGRVELPGIFVRSMTGERQYRMDELKSVGIDLDTFSDLNLGEWYDGGGN